MTLPISVDDLLKTHTVESNLIEFKEGWNPDKIMIYNLGGLDKSIRLADLVAGKAIPRRYRNRRLGDFLKEIKLTEGRLTGIQIIKSALLQNGSPDPLFETDEDRTWFSVVLRPHPTFQSNAFDDQTEEKMVANHTILIDRLKASLSGGGTDHDDHYDDHYDEVVELMIQIILFCKDSERTREELLAHIGRKRYTQTVRRYLDPLERIGWIEKTLPDKPKSKKQKYRLGEPALGVLSQDISLP